MAVIYMHRTAGTSGSNKKRKTISFVHTVDNYQVKTYQKIISFMKREAQFNFIDKWRKNKE